jgi:CHAD domain-containing protein
MAAKPALHPELAIGESLRAVAKDILADAKVAINNPKHSAAEAVHEFRRQMKRWRALLRLLEPFIGKEARTLRTAARNLARDLGGARDPQSALEAFDDLVTHRLLLANTSIKAVRKHIGNLRTAGEQSALSIGARLRISNMLADTDVAVDRWTFQVLTFGDIATQLTASYRAARRAVPRDWSDADAKALHELRKKVVIYRHQLQIVEPLWIHFTKTWITEMQRLRERLGQHQDLEMLRKLTEPPHPLARWAARLQQPIAARKHRHLVAAKRIAARLFVQKPRAFQRGLMMMRKTRQDSLGQRP